MPVAGGGCRSEQQSDFLGLALLPPVRQCNDVLLHEEVGSECCLFRTSVRD